MVSKAEEAPVRHSHQGKECHHHWIIEVANGPISKGVCRFCGAEREFYNSLPDFSFYRREKQDGGLAGRLDDKLDEESSDWEELTGDECHP